MDYKDNIPNYYQLDEDISPAGSTEVGVELVDFATGQILIDANSEEVLTGISNETFILSDEGNCTPIVISNDLSQPVAIDPINSQQSEVSLSLLGIPRSETALVLFDTVNIYGVNNKEWRASPVVADYKYWYDPGDYNFDEDFGWYFRHVPEESALQAYVYPQAKSFVYLSDDGSGRFPGGYTDGTMKATWLSKRTFRYQPGRVTGFTLGVRMSTQSNYEDEVIQWGARNDYGDGYYFQLERGTDLYIVRTSPGLGELKVARKDWNGDKLQVGEGLTGWGLDLSKVTMFKIEFSWYGAVGASFLAYVPDGVGEGRWVRLHRIFAENQFTVPSLRSAYLKLFTQAYTTAGATSAAFINLYGSSVYIDGGDEGTVTLGSTGQGEIKNIDATERTILGIQMKETINGVSNQKTVFPVTLNVYSSVDARFDLMFQRNSYYTGESYFYGNGTLLSRSNSTEIAVKRLSSSVLEIISGSFPDLSGEIAGSTNYLTGRRVKVTGSGIYKTHVEKIDGRFTQITVDRPIPVGTTSIRLHRMDEYAVANNVIASGVTNGIVFLSNQYGVWRMGASVAGSSYSDALWFTSKSTELDYNKFGQIVGESFVPSEPYHQFIFSITFPSGTSTCQLEFKDFSGNLKGTRTFTTTNPWPISLVAELMPASSVGDVVIASGTSASLIIPGSGFTNAVVQWTTTSGVTQSATAAGGTSYVANKFEASSSDPLSAVLIDKQGYRVLKDPQSANTFFVGAGESKQLDLTSAFGPDKMFLTGKPDSGNGGLFVVATARSASGVATASLDWREQ